MPIKRIFNEFKNKEITGPLLAEIVGKALRLQDGNRPITDLIIWCPSVNRGAKAAAKDYERNTGWSIMFKIVASMKNAKDS